MTGRDKGVLVTGGGTFLGNNIAEALLSEGQDVTLLVRPGTEDHLGQLARRTRWVITDVWDPASLRGRARGHRLVIHTVGSLVADPGRGLTHHRLNFVSARNVAGMCVSDGVNDMILLSSAYAPWLSRAYLKAKREAETYIGRVGVRGTIVRAPLVYPPGERRSQFFLLMTALGSIPPLSWVGLRRMAPMPVTVLSRGIARLALPAERSRTIYYAPDLRRLAGQSSPTSTYSATEADTLSVQQATEADDTTTRPSTRYPLDDIDEDMPFGWTPPIEVDDRREDDD